MRKSLSLANSTTRGNSSSTRSSIRGGKPPEKVSKSTKKQQIQLAKSFYEKGLDHWYSYEYDLALEEFTKTLLIRESVHGKYHLHTYKTYFSMGCALHGKGLYSKALLALRRSMRIATKKGDVNSQRATTNYIDWVLRKQQGDAVQQKVVEEYIETLKQSISYELNGDVHSTKGNHTVAAEEYRKSLAIEEQVSKLSVDNSGDSKSSASSSQFFDIADLYVKIADELMRQLNSDSGPEERGSEDDEEEAMDLYNKALEIYKDTFGEEHPYTKNTLQKMMTNREEIDTLTPMRPSLKNNKATSRRSMLQREVSVQDLLQSEKNSHKVDKAVKRFNRDRREFRNRTTTNTTNTNTNTTTNANANSMIIYDTPNRYFWMGLSLYANKEYDESLLAFRRTWRLREQIFGKDHYKTLHALGFISLVLEEHPKYNNTPTTPTTPTTNNNKDNKNKKKSDKNKKNTKKKSCNSSFEESRKKYHEQLFEAVAQEREGDELFYEKKDYLGALYCYQKAANLEEENVGGRNHMEWADIQTKIGDVLVEMTKYKRAVEEYRRALLIYQTTLGRGHTVTSEVYAKMEAVDKTDELLLGCSLSNH